MKDCGSDTRSDTGFKAGRTGLIVNLILFAAKLAAGILSGSLAVITDAVNNLTDAASSVVTLLGFRLAGRPADSGHPYGHARIEYIAGLIVAAIIIVTGVELGRASIEKIIEPGDMTVTAVTAAVLVASIAVKLILFFYYRAKGRKISSRLLLAAATDSRNDVLSTSAVVISLVIYNAAGINIDGFIGLGIAAFIVYSGCVVAKDTVSPLLGLPASKETKKEIEDLVLSHEKVIGVHDLMVHDYGPGHSFASVHVEFSADESARACHSVIDDMERDALRDLGVHLVIHCDPVEEGPETEAVRASVCRAVNEISEDMSVHDLHIEEDGGAKTVLFDIELPYAMLSEQDRIREAVEEKIREEGDYRVLITFDGKG